MYTVQQRIERAKVSLIRDSRFAYLAGIMMLGKTEVRSDIPTAQTNGRDVIFNPNFVDSLTDAELRGLVYHEYGGHIMMRHLTVYRSLYEADAQKANRACDYVINQVIADLNDPDFIRLPEGGLQDDRFRGMDSKQVFALLDDDDTEKPMDSHDWDGAQDMTEQEIDSSLRQSALASELLGNDVPRQIKELLEPKVDWRDALQEFFSATCKGADDPTYARPRRSMVSQDMYLPTTIHYGVDVVVLGVDASVSVNDDLINRFLTEVSAIMSTVNPAVVHLMYWGTTVAGHEVYENSDYAEMINRTKPVMAGGTDPTCLIEYMQENHIDPTCVVMLTDGYVHGRWGQWDCPVLWAITTKIRADVGTTIFI